MFHLYNLASIISLSTKKKNFSKSAIQLMGLKRQIGIGSASNNNKKKKKKKKDKCRNKSGSLSMVFIFVFPAYLFCWSISATQWLLTFKTWGFSIIKDAKHFLAFIAAILNFRPNIKLAWKYLCRKAYRNPSCTAIQSMKSTRLLVKCM